MLLELVLFLLHIDSFSLVYPVDLMLFIKLEFLFVNLICEMIIPASIKAQPINPRNAMPSLKTIHPLLLLNKNRKFENKKFLPLLSDKTLLKGGIVAGIIIFFGASFQQGGIVYTSAGKAGFITGLYIILVPIFGLMFKQKTSSGTWIGALVAVVGLYLLSVKSDLSIGLGDLLVLASAFFGQLMFYG